MGTAVVCCVYALRVVYGSCVCCVCCVRAACAACVLRACCVYLVRCVRSSARLTTRKSIRRTAAHQSTTSTWKRYVFYHPLPSLLSLLLFVIISSSTLPFLTPSPLSLSDLLLGCVVPYLFGMSKVCYY